MFGDERGVLSGQLQARQMDLARWQALFFPSIKEPVQGTLTGTFNLSGSPQDPVVQVAGKIQQAHWRAFHFESRIKAPGRRKD
jgi:hypothetical protein